MKITSHSHLMHSYVAGRSLPAQRSIGVAVSAADMPVLVSIDTVGVMRATLAAAQSVTGWTQVDLNAQLQNQFGLGASPMVHCMAMSQDRGGCIWLAFGAAANATALPRLFCASFAAPAGKLDDWRLLASLVVERPLPNGFHLREIDIGTNDDHGSAPLIVVAGAGKNGYAEHHRLNALPQPGNSSSTQLHFPQNAVECLCTAVGYVAGYGRGVYTLCRLGSERTLIFSALPVDVGGHPFVQSPAVGTS